MPREIISNCYVKWSIIYEIVSRETFWMPLVLPVSTVNESFQFHTNVHKGITFRKIQFSETTLEWIWLWCCHGLWAPWPSCGQNIKNSQFIKNPNIVRLNIVQFTVGNPDIHLFFLFLILLKMQIRPKGDFANKMFTNHQIRESHQLCITWIKIQMVSKHYRFHVTDVCNWYKLNILEEQKWDTIFKEV